MIDDLSLDTQAILLLSEPLLSDDKQTRPDSDGSHPPPSLLTPGECRRLISHLDQMGRKPADLLNDGSGSLLSKIDPGIDVSRLQRLLGRQQALATAAARWREQSIWGVSIFDDDYPYRFRERVGAKRPLVCFGRGDASLLSWKRASPSLGVVGPRDAGPSQVSISKTVGSLAAEAGITVVSGGARGVDQAAMQGALRNGGWVVGILADRLARMASQAEARSWIEDGQLTLVSIRDPLAAFSVGYAMQRNKLIYALTDASLVVGASYQRGGTWAGAIEQLRTLHYAPIYVWDSGQPDPARDALIALGATVWPSPSSSSAVRKLVSAEDGETLPLPGPAV